MLAKTTLVFILDAAIAQYGILDPSFGNSTPAGTDIFTTPGVGYFQMSMAFQRDGKMLISNGGTISCNCKAVIVGPMLK